MNRFCSGVIHQYHSVCVMAAITAFGLNASSDFEASQSEVAVTSYAANPSNPSGNVPGDAATTPTVADRGEGVIKNNLTRPQRNAARSAYSYLSMTGFSRDGLIDQLSSDAGEGYSVVDATAAVDSLNVDWKENAARSAKEYLNMTGFSCKRLIEQLSSSAGSQYTLEQATYGAHAAGAC